MLFGPKRVEDVEREIRKLEVWLQELEKKREWILSKIEKIEEKEGNLQLVNVMRELNEAEKRFFEINRRIGIDTLQALKSGEGGVLDATKINPNILREYQIAKRELINLQKQENYLKKLLEEEKSHKVRALGHEYIHVMNKFEEVNKKLKALKMARKK